MSHLTDPFCSAAKNREKISEKEDRLVEPSERTECYFQEVVFFVVSAVIVLGHFGKMNAVQVLAVIISTLATSARGKFS